MKKLLLVFLLSLLSVGCTITPKDTSHGIEKLDQSKDYVFVKGSDSFNLEAILKDKGMFEDTKNSFEFDFEFDDQDIDDEKLLLNEEIVVNLNSKDAQELQLKLNKIYEANKETREKGLESIKNNDISFGWQSSHLKDYETTDDYFSFSTYSSSMVVPGEGRFTLNAYTLRLSDGKLLSNEEVLALKDIDMKVLTESIKKDFKDNKIEIYGEKMGRELVTDVPSDLDGSNVLYFRIKPEHGIMINEEEVTVILEQYLGLSGEFSLPITYEVEIQDIK